MFRLSILLLFFCATQGLYGSGNMRIGLFQGAAVEQLDILLIRGNVSFLLDETVEIKLKSGDSYQVIPHEGALALSIKGQSTRHCKTLKLNSEKGAQFRLRPPAKKSNMRIYEGDLHFYRKDGGVQVVLEIGLEEYVSGVIEAESGKGKLTEYYKVQAVISRTYALNNLRRHETEGFHLCDATHCQVYHGKSQFEELIPKATAATEDIVIVDSDIELITATFHSNCGGHTVNSEDVWSKPVSYLVGRPDTFCVKMPNSQWEKTIPSEDWKGYLFRKKQVLPDSLTLCFPSDSRTFFPLDSSYLIPTKFIREDFKLKSTRFEVQPEGSLVRLMGRGFGHAVGLCQEGAMVMAGYGYTYKDIVHFYYKDVHLIPRNFIRFFAED